MRQRSASALPVVALVGPTASGKTALGVAVAQRLRGEVVNADALQFYRGMDIGTAKASEDERGGVPHHLLDVLEIDQAASVADFQGWAREAIAQIRARGHVPVLAGGSGLYVRAAVDTLEFPPTDPQVREELETRAQQEGTAALRAELAVVDPASAERLGDDRRVIRALEVHRITGRPFSSFMPERRYHHDVGPVVQIGLRIPREVLHERIQRRVELMVERGLLEEVRALDARGLREGPTAARAIGYQQMLDVLDGRCTLRQAVEETVVATRRFARRQETWFRADPRVLWLDWDAPDLVDQAVAVVHAATEERAPGTPRLEP
ncbi:tRNA (adenosine(37)-N6)-dimethylallyltransferase MiaA [Micrococcus terreus]|uniref:tRNA (adenosine(37)-N6)-dimethylallyltransferase MiaA n=1 Tax=Micrococcus terreus TaxID=574650 RepID=UPI0030184021